MTIEDVKAMSDEELRVKVAELRGWRRFPYLMPEYIGIEMNGSVWCAPECPVHVTGIRPVPEYTADLNAMYAAEETMTDAECQRYIDCLAKVTNAEFEGVPNSDPLWNHWSIYHATARQRAEAFVLKTTKR